MQQCCDHPYLVDETLQISLIKGQPVTDILDIGVHASGKLLLLDKMLREIKEKGLRVIILSQVSLLWYHAWNKMSYFQYFVLAQFMHNLLWVFITTFIQRFAILSICTFWRMHWFIFGYSSMRWWFSFTSQFVNVMQSVINFSSCLCSLLCTSCQIVKYITFGTSETGDISL